MGDIPRFRDVDFVEKDVVVGEGFEERDVAVEGGGDTIVPDLVRLWRLDLHSAAHRFFKGIQRAVWLEEDDRVRIRQIRRVHLQLHLQHIAEPSQSAYCPHLKVKRDSIDYSPNILVNCILPTTTESNNTVKVKAPVAA